MLRIVTGGLFSIVLTIIATGLTSSHAAQVSEAANVTALLDRYFAAASERDVSKVEPFWANDSEVVLVFPSDKQAAVGWDAVKKSYQAVFDRFSEWKLSPREAPDIQVRSATAVATTKVLIQGTGKTGTPISYTLLFSQVLIQRDGRWLIVAAHGSRIPD
jgi:ketosteroid isomerase-like protein